MAPFAARTERPQQRGWAARIDRAAAPKVLVTSGHEFACPRRPATAGLRHHRPTRCPDNRDTPADTSTVATTRPGNSRHAHSAFGDGTDKRTADADVNTIAVSRSGWCVSPTAQR